MPQKSIFIVSFAYILAISQVSLGLPPLTDNLSEIDNQCSKALEVVRVKISNSQARAIYNSDSNSTNLSVVLNHKDTSDESWWRVENILQSKQYLTSVGGQILKSCKQFSSVYICVVNSECFKRVFIDDQGKVRLVKLGFGEPEQLLN